MPSNIFYGDPTTVNDVSPTANVGDYFYYKHSTYGWWKLRYVQFLNAVTAVAGHVCCPVAKDGTTITNDITGGSATPFAVIFGGLLLNVVTANYYCYALVWGRYPTIATSGADDIAAGESLIMHASTDGTCDGVAANATTVASFGVANTADVDAANTVDGNIGNHFFVGP